MSTYWRLSAELAAEGVTVKAMTRSEAARYAALSRWGPNANTWKPMGAPVSAKAWADLMEPDGGFTINQTTGEQPKEGFAVAIRGHSSITKSEEFFSGEPGNEKGRKIIKDWLVEKAELFDDDSMHIGAWHNPKTGEIVLDPARVISDRKEAIRAGVEANQIAIADLAAIARGDWDNAFIDTGGTGD